MKLSFCAWEGGKYFRYKFLFIFLDTKNKYNGNGFISKYEVSLTEMSLFHNFKD